MPRQIKINTEFTVYDSLEELKEQDKELLLLAKKTSENAYAPYSNFFVGAAVLLENGIIVTGNNQENAAYPSGLCAERVAVFHASSQYPGVKIKTIAVTAKSSKQIIRTPVPPCGGCRQSLSEYEVKFKSPVRVILSGQEGPVYISDSISNLLPLSFTAESL
ncbi:MAG: cytidine deaminase [Bacteroidetes bacterium]|nr:cytidine deaminase [Bacteroidota bacterium]